jgi:hypothetical protein
MEHDQADECIRAIIDAMHQFGEDGVDEHVILHALICTTIGAVGNTSCPCCQRKRIDTIREHLDQLEATLPDGHIH